MADRPADPDRIRRTFHRFVRWEMPGPDERPPREPPPGYMSVIVVVNRENMEYRAWHETPKAPAM